MEIKEFNEMALKWGKSHQSSQTGYIHHFTTHTEQRDTIPINENFIFALALLQSRTSENMVEGKAMIERLLHFENRDLGNFPVYMHQYPHCTDRLHGVQLLPTFYWILQQFHSILGEQLKGKIEATVNRLLNAATSACKEIKAPDFIKYKLAVSLKAFNQQSYEPFSRTDSWFSPASLGDFILSMQMVDLTLQESGFWDHLQVCWHPHLNSYIGPAIKEYEVGLEPQVTLLDLFCGYLSGQLSARAKLPNVAHLHAALLRPCEKRFQFTPLHQSEGKWQLEKQPSYSYALVEKPADQQDKGFHSFKMCWGDSKRLHTFVSQGGAHQQVTFKAENKLIELYFNLGAFSNDEEREKSKEIACYLDLQDHIQLLVSGKNASTFSLKDHVEIKSSEINLRIDFEIIEGEGQFVGHLMRGNRPSQLAASGINRFEAYDWQIFLRTLRRSAPCTVKLTITII